ncbi:hypothetical protein [Robbsia andropogonis]|uniref:hypothetical protein n=1 Tax=Robbsia andropogonis TaxID=28092 RepID=UPI002A6AEDF8|nr:hypothetical protein [Robbsia andropogonis]
MTLSTVVFVILLILKLAGIGIVAGWSWWAVTAPLWAGYAACLALFVIGAVLVICAEALGWSKRKPPLRSWRR